MKTIDLSDFSLWVPTAKRLKKNETSYSFFEDKPNYILRHVWGEGYRATGEHATASYIGCVEANSFEEACEILCKGRLDKNKDGSLRYERPSIWGCRLYSTEKEASKSFG